MLDYVLILDAVLQVIDSGKKWQNRGGRWQNRRISGLGTLAIESELSWKTLTTL